MHTYLHRSYRCNEKNFTTMTFTQDWFLVFLINIAANVDIMIVQRYCCTWLINKKNVWICSKLKIYTWDVYLWIYIYVCIYINTYTECSRFKSIHVKIFTEFLSKHFHFHFKKHDGSFCFPIFVSIDLNETPCIER